MAVLVDSRFLRLLMAVVAATVFAAVAEAAKLPEWVTAPPADDADYMYGVGEGDDRDSAKSAALAAIAGTLMTDVSSSIAVSQTLKQGQFEEEVRNQVDTQVQDTELSNYQVLEAKRVKKRWWVLVQLPRAEFIAATRAQLEQSDQSLANSMARLERQSALEQYFNFSPLIGQLESTQATLALLRAADTGFDGGDYTNRYLDYEDTLASVQRNVDIRVDSDATAESFGRKLVTLLNAEKLRASMGKAGAGQATVEVRSQAEDFEFGSDVESRVTVRITTLSDKGDILASVERMRVGGSPTSKEAARSQALGQLTRDAESQGVFRYLGLSVAQ